MYPTVLIVSATLCVAGVMILFLVTFQAMQLRDIKKTCKLSTWGSVSIPNPKYANSASRLIFCFNLSRGVLFSSIVMIGVGFFLNPGPESVSKETFNLAYALLVSGGLTAILATYNTIMCSLEINKHFFS